jgi:23S rRNA (guanine745-N1)-methyltransferase
VGEARLACTVRGCGLQLSRDERRWVCPAGHSYDIARSGYINLLQPQDRRSLEAGDSREVVEARARLHDAGLGRTLIDAIANQIRALALPQGAQVVDLGCGTGDALAAVAAMADMAAIGIDLSTAAIERAARRYPALTWVVANADRQLPLPDASTQLLLSINARRNPGEGRRVLAPGGYLLVALPAPDDLIELRTAVQGDAVERDRVESLIVDHDDTFTLADRLTVRERVHLDAERLKDLLRTTYRGARAQQAERAAALSGMEVTLASELVLLRRR